MERSSYQNRRQECLGTLFEHHYSHWAQWRIANAHAGRPLGSRRRIPVAGLAVGCLPGYLAIDGW